MSGLEGGGSEGDRRALVKALREGAADDVLAILERRPNLATTITPQPLAHLAVVARTNARRQLETLLKAGAPHDITNAAGLTALHVAAFRGVSACVRTLLAAGCDVNYQDRDGRIPLFYAARGRANNATRCVHLLLEAGSALDVADTNGTTPLHTAVEAGNVEAAKAILGAGASHGCRDNQGLTPLHLARTSAMVEALLQAGADVTALDHCRKSPLDQAIRHNAALAQTMLGAGVAVQGGLHDLDLKVFFNLSLLRGSSEMKVLARMASTGRLDMLKHPLCETYLHLKWCLVAPLFYIKLALYVCLVLALTGDVCLRYQLRQFASTSTNSSSSSGTGGHDGSSQYHTVRGLAMVCQVLGSALLVVVAVRMVVLMGVARAKYWRRLEKWVELVWCGCGAVVLAMEGPLEGWQRHVAVPAVLLAWLHLTVLVGHIPSVGIYIMMFQTVAVNLLTFIAIYGLLFVGFAVSFYLMFEDEVFGTLTSSSLKTLAMMVGELDISNLLEPDSSQVLQGTTQVVFVAFVFAMTIVVANLLVGLAVKDIQELVKEAGVNRLALTIKQEVAVDQVLYSSLLNPFLLGCASDWLKRRLSLLHTFPARSLRHQTNSHSKPSTLLGSEWSGPMESYNVFICPNDPHSPHRVYCYLKPKSYVPTKYLLPTWIVRNTRNLLQESGYATVPQDPSTSDDEDEVDACAEHTTLETLQYQINDLQCSVSEISQLLRRLNDKL